MKSEIEKAAEEESVTTAIRTTTQAAFRQGYLAGARKLLELAESNVEAFHIKQNDKIAADAFLAVRMDVLRKLVEGEE